MNTKVQQDKTDRALEVERIINELSESPNGHYLILEPGDALYVEPADELVKPLTELRSQSLAEARESNGFICRYYYPDGREVPFSERTEEWWDSVLDGVDSRLWNAVALQPNAVMLLGGDVLLVGTGRWHAAEETTLNGEPAIRFTSTARAMEEMRAKERRWLEAHPEVSGLRPRWATDEDVTILDDEVTVTFEASVGSAFVDVTLMWTDGVVEWMDGGAPHFHTEVETHDIDEARTGAANLLTLVDIVAGNSEA